MSARSAVVCAPCPSTRTASPRTTSGEAIRYTPRGSDTVPPTPWFHSKVSIAVREAASMAAWMAGASSATPSPFAPHHCG